MYAIVHEEMVSGLEHLDRETKAKVIAAYVDYQLYWVEPSKDDVLVYSIFKAKQYDLNVIKNKSEIARENGKKWGRPRKDLSVKNLAKTKKTQTKANDNQTEPRRNQNETKANPEKPLEIEIDNINKNINNINNNILSISNTESKDSDINNITSNINKLISELKEESNSLGIVYDKKDERNFSKHILTAKDFWEFAEKIWQSRNEFARNIMRASVLIHFWKWVCSWPKLIYQNYAEVYNKSLQEHAKQQKNKIYSF